MTMNTDFVRPYCGLVPIFLREVKGILVDITTLADCSNLRQEG